MCSLNLNLYPFRLKPHRVTLEYTERVNYNSVVRPHTRCSLSGKADEHNYASGMVVET